MSTMLYNTPEKFDEELFKSPTAIYRGAPFWAWNSRLDKETLKRQVDCFHEMGFGGFHVHVRQGLESEYLGEEFMDAVDASLNRAKEHGMYTWLYDEDRWPSGYCGGRVTKNIKYRQRHLLNTATKKEGAVYTKEESWETGAPYFLGAFDIFFDSHGIMTDYRRVDENAPAAADATRRYFYCMTAEGGEYRFNYQSYVDTLSVAAMDEFIKESYDKYYERFGEEFGKSIPAIFTDEPQVYPSFPISSSDSDEDCRRAFTADVPESFFKTYGYDLTDKLPDLFYDSGESGYTVKCHFNRHISERFNEAFVDNIGKWCGKHGIRITGHSMGEDTLYEQLLSNPDVMRTYREMQLPGIDVLCDDRNFIAAIQCRSVVRQYAREGMLSELYGVTGWDFDFRGHKFQGDWQAALGVTVRVQHLAWQTMKGNGKRDYPAPIFYQSPWWREYSRIEDHFARIHTAMTRGVAKPRVAVVHPVESYGILYSTKTTSGDKTAELETHFRELSEWLVGNFIDYDYIAESLLPELCPTATAPLKVGAATYDAVIVEDCLTLRETTAKRLSDFAKAGGKLIIMGNAPKYIDGTPWAECDEFCRLGVTLPHSKHRLMELVEEYRDFSVTSGGVNATGLMHGIRYDGDERWIFIAHSVFPELTHATNCEKCQLRVRGSVTPTLYDTLTGDVRPLPCTYESGDTVIPLDVYSLDSFLIRLVPGEACESGTSSDAYKSSELLESAYRVDFTLSEPNPLLLDMAEYSLDGEDFRGRNEILKIDEEIRARLSLDSRKVKSVQPWYVPEAKEDHTVALRFRFNSECDVADTSLALENAEKATVRVNGRICDKINGYYVDEEIKTVYVGDIRKGENVIEITQPFGLRTDLENAFLLGSFGTRIIGREAVIVPMPEKLYFGNIVGQGLDFYGGNVTYTDYLDADGESDYAFDVNYYRGALVKIMIDGEELGASFTPPYRTVAKGLSAGTHKVEYVLLGTRYNTFSALHNLAHNKKRVYIGPIFWHSEGDMWTYEYITRPMGILKAPEIVKLTK